MAAVKLPAAESDSKGRAVSIITEQPDISMSAVAELCGFNELSTFSHTFRRMYGCAPSQYAVRDEE